MSTMRAREIALLAALALLIVSEIVVIAPRWSAAAVVAVGAWVIVPGIALARRAFGDRDRSGIAAWLVGPALGLGFSVFGIFLLWAAGVQNWIAIIAGPGLTWLLVAAARHWGGPSLSLPTLSRADIVAVGLALLVVPLVTWVPYDHVRQPVAEGEAYRAYFTADFVWGMTVTTEIAKGDVPPANPFLRGAALHYYWLSHLLSGVIYRNVHNWGVTAEQVLLIDGLVFGLVAVAFFYALARMSGASPPFAALMVSAAFVANSYEGLERLWVYYRQGTSWDAVKAINIDAVTRWFYQGMPVDGLQRMLLYQPHHLTGYMLALSALWLVTHANDIAETAVALWTGMLLGLGFLFSTFTAIIVGVAVGVVFAGRLLARWNLAATLQAAILAAAPLVVAVALAFVLGYNDPAQGSLITLGLNRVAARQWPLMLVLSFGPLLLIAAPGLLRWKWLRREGAAPAALIATALAFYFMVDVRDQGGVWVGWRSGHLLLIGFSAIAAAALTAAWQLRSWRVPLAVAVAIVLFAAVPTVAIDVYNAQDITNRGRGPGFPWTLIITPPERAALDWLRTSTPPDAVVQYEPTVRGAGWWCYLTAFAERRMAAGLPGAMIPFKPYQEASETVRLGVFGAPSAVDSHRIALNMQVDYILIGPHEQSAYRSAIIRMDERPDLFATVFHNDVVTIYRVQR